MPFLIIGLITGLKLFQDEPEDALIASVEPYSPWNWISGGKLRLKIFGFSEIPPEMRISDKFVMYFGFLLRIFILDLFVKHLGWYFGFLYTLT